MQIRVKIIITFLTDWLYDQLNLEVANLGDYIRQEKTFENVTSISKTCQAFSKISKNGIIQVLHLQVVA